MTDASTATADKAATATKLNDSQVCALFGVTPMTLRHWRQGTPRRTALPHVTDKTGTFVSERKHPTIGRLSPVWLVAAHCESCGHDFEVEEDRTKR